MAFVQPKSGRKSSAVARALAGPRGASQAHAQDSRRALCSHSPCLLTPLTLIHIFWCVDLRRTREHIYLSDASRTDLLDRPPSRAHEPAHGLDTTNDDHREKSECFGNDTRGALGRRDSRLKGGSLGVCVQRRRADTHTRACAHRSRHTAAADLTFDTGATTKQRDKYEHEQR